jgi:hypothetical protein
LSQRRRRRRGSRRSRNRSRRGGRSPSKGAVARVRANLCYCRQSLQRRRGSFRGRRGLPVSWLGRLPRALIHPEAAVGVFGLLVGLHDAVGDPQREGGNGVGAAAIDDLQVDPDRVVESGEAGVLARVVEDPEGENNVIANAVLRKNSLAKGEDGGRQRSYRRRRRRRRRFCEGDRSSRRELVIEKALLLSFLLLPSSFRIVACPIYIPPLHDALTPSSTAPRTSSHGPGTAASPPRPVFVVGAFLRVLRLLRRCLCFLRFLPPPPPPPTTTTARRSPRPPRPPRRSPARRARSSDRTATPREGPAG